jgi:uncharacterized protein (DUF1697 family)
MAQRSGIYVALLRGINVGGNILEMDRLREICTQLGAQDVRTYVQSGNLVFNAEGSAPQWTERLERKLLGETRLPAHVIVRTAAEMNAIRDGNPFLKEKGIDTTRLAVTFLQSVPGKESLAAVNAMKPESERFHCAGKELYLHCPKGFADAKLYSLDKVLRQKTTVRNWTTVLKLCEMCAEVAASVRQD